MHQNIAPGSKTIGLTGGAERAACLKKDNQQLVNWLVHIMPGNNPHLTITSRLDEQKNINQTHIHSSSGLFYCISTNEWAGLWLGNDKLLMTAGS